MERTNCKEKRILPHILLIYRVMIPSVRLCAHGQLSYLAEQGHIEYRAVQESSITHRDLEWADTVIQVRSDSWYEAKLVKMLHAKGRYLVYAMDDDLFNVPTECGDLSVFYQSPEVRSRMRYMQAHSDAFFSSSPLILERYANEKQLQVLVKGYATEISPFARHDACGPVCIAFAGSVDRWEDIAGCMSDALSRLKQTYGDRIQFVFVGASPSFAKELEPIVIPYIDSYQEYRRRIDALKIDIGLAPMPDSPFHACKYINKFIEYAAAGAVGVFSDVEPYAALRREGAPGVFCKNTPQAWYDAIRSLIDDPERRERMRREAYAMVQEQYSLSKAAESLLLQIEPILRFQARPARFRKDLLASQKIGNVSTRLLDAARKYKWRLPAVAVKKALGKVKSIR